MRFAICFGLFLTSACGGKENFGVPGEGDSSDSEPSTEQNVDLIDCPASWTDREDHWIDPDACVAWSSPSSPLTWHATVSPSEAENGGCTENCDQLSAENYCRDLSTGGYEHWRTPTITELERMTTGNPPFDNTDPDLWSLNSDAFDVMAWTASVAMPGMSVLLQKDSRISVRCIAD